MKGTRADIRLVELGLAESREKARSLIMSGVVMLDGRRVEKPGENLPEDCTPSVKEDPVPFVSRGGLKLDKAVRVYGIDLKDKVCVDVGASTGGFTDCMLKNGARHVYAVDVGYGQLDWRLRNDPRVSVMERRNARFMEPAWFDETPSFAATDVSFISIKLILPPMFACLGDEAQAVVLVKPQFEAGREKVGKNGVVRDPSVHEAVLHEAVSYALDCGFQIRHIDYSPITGPKGNIEFLMVLEKNKHTVTTEHAEAEFSDCIAFTVKKAHESLK